MPQELLLDGPQKESVDQLISEGYDIPAETEELPDFGIIPMSVHASKIIFCEEDRHFYFVAPDYSQTKRTPRTYLGKFFIDETTNVIRYRNCRGIECVLVLPNGEQRFCGISTSDDVDPY